jgi:hypothetical protein
MSAGTMDNLKRDLKDAAENILVYERAAAVAIPILSGRPANGPEYVLAGSLPDILRILETLK